jgi:DegV family protein with EDD domain
MKVALVTDSNAQMPRALLDRYGVRVVPLTVVVDGNVYQEGIDLDPGEFYRRLAEGATVSTAAPAPGAVLAAYEAAAADGVGAILSIHIGSNTSATLSAVAIAARMSPIPVTVVDTGTASFAIGCCVWAAGAALEMGASVTDAAATAYRVAGDVGNVFVVGALELARRGGRLAAGAEHGAGVAVLALEGGQMRVLERVHDEGGAVEAMARYVETVAAGRRRRVGVGDALAGDLGDALATRLERGGAVAELVRYEVGPSVGAHTGAGTVGAVFFPAPSG